MKKGGSRYIESGKDTYNEGDSTGRNDDSTLKKSSKTGDVNVMDLVPCCALCCCIASCFTELPDCLGSVCSYGMCCCSCSILTCKPSKEDRAFCRLCASDVDIVPFDACCQARGQCFCCDGRISFPPTAEIPCIFTVCCLSCCYDNAFLCVWGKQVRDMHAFVNRQIGSEHGGDSANKNIRDDDDAVAGNHEDWVSLKDPNSGQT